MGTPQNFNADKRLLREWINRPFARGPDEDKDGASLRVGGSAPPAADYLLDLPFSTLTAGPH